jgi:uncharacterized protein (DUF1330 family)
MIERVGDCDLDGIERCCSPWAASLRRPGLGRLIRLVQNGVMTAYWISFYKEIIDDDKLAAYAKLARPALEASGGTFLARGLPELTYEAGAMTRVVVVEFDSVDAARTAHDSAGYQEALAALDGGAVRDLRIVAGGS